MNSINLSQITSFTSENSKLALILCCCFLQGTSNIRFSAGWFYLLFSAFAWPSCVWVGVKNMWMGDLSVWQIRNWERGWCRKRDGYLQRGQEKARAVNSLTSRKHNRNMIFSQQVDKWFLTVSAHWHCTADYSQCVLNRNLWILAYFMCFCVHILETITCISLTLLCNCCS